MSVIGRAVIVSHQGQQYTATVIDAVAGENRAKRVRVQSKGKMQGSVLMPGQYEIKEFL